jgi:hypothetical protein
MAHVLVVPGKLEEIENSEVYVENASGKRVFWGDVGERGQPL